MKKDIFHRIEEEAKPDFSGILSKSFELFKKVRKEAVYHVLITMAIAIPLILLIYVPLLIMVSLRGGFDGPGYHSVNDYYGNNFEPPILWIVIYCFVLFIVTFII
ncbi:MAG: hypothetical protein ACI9SJ_001517 [Flavobacteriaceae bacterium]|jgi:hypothetical protein|uniref:hypothetical protein n=1 Tax=Candidatus Marifrigoribacter sp. Uisw_064 TaxID=3230970 RepID=UPI003AE2F955